MNTTRYKDDEPINEPIQRKSCRQVLQVWLDHPSTEEDAWAKLTYQQIRQQLLTRFGEKISVSSIAIHLPALVAMKLEKPIRWVQTIRNKVRQASRQPGAQIDETRLQQLYANFDADVDPKVCASELQMHYNTVLKYKRRWKAERDKQVSDE